MAGTSAVSAGKAEAAMFVFDGGQRNETFKK
jgi:hypothetical protein